MNISKLLDKDTAYPDQLRQIASPPKQLYLLGRWQPDRPLVAVVGSRRPTEYGLQVTYQLASQLAAAGVGIVSGLALGIDAAAHAAALEGGGYTIAVQACGLDQIYPASNRSLGKRILQAGGAIISEYPSGMPPLRHNFVARNRLITGLSQAVIITEAAAASGALISANFALEQNKLVMAVPGPITSLKSAGPNNLLRSGAMAVTSTSDVLAALDLVTPAAIATKTSPKSQIEAVILGLLKSGINTSQELIEQSALTAAEFAHVISLMEITGKVRNLGAGNWVPR